MIGFFTGVFQLDGVSLWYDESVMRVVAYIENHRQPNDALLIGDALMLIPFMAYFEGDIPVVFLKEGELKDMPTPAPDYFRVVLTYERVYTWVMLIGVKFEE